jgi:hypothetical protein
MVERVGDGTKLVRSIAGRAGGPPRHVITTAVLGDS